MSNVLNVRPFSGIPAFFRAGCQQASRGGSSSHGYRTPGYELTRHLDTLLPRHLSPDEWREELDRLTDLVFPTDPQTNRIYFVDRNDEAVLAWFSRWYPRCLEFVPPRRRGQFLTGV